MVGMENNINEEFLNEHLMEIRKQTWFDDSVMP